MPRLAGRQGQDRGVAPVKVAPVELVHVPGSEAPQGLLVAVPLLNLVRLPVIVSLWARSVPVVEDLKPGVHPKLSCDVRYELVPQ